MLLDPIDYSWAIELTARGIGLIYVIAYVPFLYQYQGLWGKQGICPIETYLNMLEMRLGTRRFWKAPTLFWFRSDEKAILGLVWIGILLGILLFLGVYPCLMLFLLYFIHLSWANAGQDFMGFGWETYLMEITVGLFLTMATAPLNYAGWIALNVLLFRFFFQAGITKWLSGDPSWRKLTAIAYHYLTQPIPNAISWYAYRLPLAFQKLTVLFLFWAEVVVPFLIFSPPLIRLFAFSQFIMLQIGIGITGNFSFLNAMTAVFCITLIHNAYLAPWLGAPPYFMDSHWLWYGLISLLGLSYLTLQLLNLYQTFRRNQVVDRLMSLLYPFHLAYTHAIFSIMTTERLEVVIEGSLDGKNWNEYVFKYKPGPLDRIPCQIAPFQPRLDWQAWFLPFSPFKRQQWLQRFFYCLLSGYQPVLKLLAHDPFPGQKPLYIRALLYDYTFSTPAEKKQTGNLWKRRLIGEYSDICQLPIYQPLVKISHFD